ncbi:MAG: exo-alpha-sialidase [Candidatus Omnitrophica bacterium]|nr:exo-alpha-sialidase [Candidatus Omnitrophota bacterium]MCB9783747.1 exo-alpha-sialidase [Candidatus Omnitrophota bacterium]
MIRNILLVSVFLTFASSAIAQIAEEEKDIIVERVFGREHPGIYKHPASITELENGDLYIAYYGGSGEYEDDTAVYGSRLKQGETEWSFPEVIADTPGRGEGNPVVWQAPDGVVWLFYVNRYGDTWSNARVKAKISKDGARTWSDSFMFSMEEGSMVKGAPIVLNNGDYLLPMYHETGEDINKTVASTTSYFMRYSPQTGEWTESNRIASPMGNLQAEVAQISDDYLVCYIRRGGDFLPTDDGWLLRSESRDGGHTWTEAKQTEFKNPNSAVAFLRLQNGHLMLIFNDDMNVRTPLRVAVSTDDDETYPYARNVIGGDNTYAYPYAIQTKDGKIHIVCTTNNRTSILHITFDETAILDWEI